MTKELADAIKILKKRIKEHEFNEIINFMGFPDNWLNLKGFN